MKRIQLVCIVLFSITVICFTSCGKNNKNENLQGVTVNDSGQVAVTFVVPDGRTVEDVLGCEIGSENTVIISDLEKSSSTAKHAFWYTVSSGGILSRFGDVYCYGPEATTSNTTGVTAPPGWIMLYSEPSEDAIFNPEDADALKEKYGIQLYFTGEAQSTNVIADGNSYNASDYSFSEVKRWCDGFSDGYCLVHTDSKDGNPAGIFILSKDGIMVESPSYSISNFCNGSALAHVGIDDGDSADSIIDEKGNVIWSITKEGASAATEFFSDVEVTDISSPFRVTYDTSNAFDADRYYGYFPIEFSIESFDYTGTYIGILNGKGEWVVEPTTKSHTYAWSLDEHYIVTNTYLFDYSSGEVEYFGADADDDSVANEKCDELREKLTKKGELADHNGLIFENNTDEEKVGFFNEKGKLVIDLSNYNLRSSPEFVDGYALLEIQNKQYSDYLVVIDSSGNEMFEPIKDNGHGDLSEGIFFTYDNENGFFMNVNGEKIGNIVGNDYISCHDDRAWIETKEGWKCIDSKGNDIFNNKAM